MVKRICNMALAVVMTIFIAPVFLTGGFWLPFELGQSKAYAEQHLPVNPDTIRLEMYVVKATTGNESVPQSLASIKNDLKSSGYSNFSLIRTAVVSLPSGRNEDQPLDRGYSLNVTPTGTSSSASLSVKFYKGTDLVFSGSNTATKTKNAMFVLRGIYENGAIIVVFALN